MVVKNKVIGRIKIIQTNEERPLMVWDTSKKLGQQKLTDVPNIPKGQSLAWCAHFCDSLRETLVNHLLFFL